MTNFAATTAFGLVRRLGAAGLDAPALYLLLRDGASALALRDDFAAEIQIQLGGKLRFLEAASIDPDELETAFRAQSQVVLLVDFDQWEAHLILSMDRNVTLVTDGGPVLLLISVELGERLLAAAPNLRSRLTDVLVIQPDEAFGGLGNES